MSVAAPGRLHGLPERLPAGETLLWQGAPDWRILLRHAFHLRAVCVYFAVILACCLGSAVRAGLPAGEIAHGMAIKLGLALVPLALMALYAWAIQRSTLYSITNRRVVVSFGIALPMSFNLPFSTIEGAGMRIYPGGGGDLPLRMMPGEKLSYFVMWPHARPWHMARTQPMLRGIAGVEKVAGILAGALADQVVRAPVQLRRPVRLGVPTGLRGRAVAAE